MHVTDFRGDVVFAAQEVQTESAAAGEIGVGCSFGDLVIGKENAAADLDIRNYAAARGERPFEGERIYADAVGRVRFLNYQEDWNSVHRIFQPAAQETGAVWRGEDQAIAEARVP